MITRRQPRDRFVPAVCGGMLFAMFVIAVTALLPFEPHPFYSGLSISLMFASSLILFLLSFDRRVTVQLACLMWTLYFSHRFVSTYWMPLTLDYQRYANFTTAEIERALSYYLLSVCGVVCGAVLAKVRWTARSKAVALPAPGSPDDTLSVFGVRVGLVAFLKPFLRLLIILYALKLYFAVMYDFGLTGSTYEVEAAPLMRIVTLADTLALPVIFLLVYLPRSSPVYRLLVATFILMLVSGIVASSRALIWSIVFSMYVSARVLNRRIHPKYYRVGLAAIAFAVFIYFPFITGVRAVLLGGDMLTLEQFADPQMMSSVSARIGSAYESFILWFSRAHEVGVNPAQFSLFRDAAALVNSLVPGELIQVGETVNLPKLQPVIGRGYDPAMLEELGGHAENVGPWGTAYLYFGYYAAFYWGFLYFVLIKLEQSAMHPFWKYFFMTTYAAGPSNVILMTGGVFTFLFLLSPTAMAIALRDEILTVLKRNFIPGRRRRHVIKEPS